MYMMKVTIAIILALAICGVPALAACGGSGVYATIFPFNPSGCAEMPRLPHSFGGCVYINDEPAPEGTRVCVAGNGVTGNCIAVGPGGCFGMGTFDEKLVATGIPVPGVGMVNVPEGTDLQFYVNGERARVCVGSSCQWTTQFHTGHHTYITLNITVPEPCCGK